MIQDSRLAQESYEKNLAKRITKSVMSALKNPIIPGGKISRERMQQLRNLPYEEYLKTSEWRAIRSFVHDLADGRCAVCGCDCEWLYVHHNNYPARGAETPNDLIPLCGKCHEMFHVGARVLLSDEADKKLNILAKFDDVNLNNTLTFHAIALAMEIVRDEVELRKKAMDSEASNEVSK